MLFEANSVSFVRGERAVLDSVSLSVAPGEAVALVGPNGSGKTTFIKLATSYLKPTAGTIAVLGGAKLGPKRRRRVGVVWQDRGLPLAVSSKRWIAHLAALYGNKVDQDLLERLEVPVTKTPLRYLSGGEQQRLAIYGAFAHQPKLLLLDEPTVGLDDAVRSTFYSLVRERLRSEVGVLFTSHYAQDVAILANRFVDLNPIVSEVAKAAIFTVDGVLDIFAAAAALPPGYQLLSTTNGYRLKGSEPGELLAIATEVARTQNLAVLSFTVVGNV